MGVALIALGSILGEIAGVSYNALLVSISTPKTVGKVSGLGWGFGYLGGIIALATVVGLILGGVLIKKLNILRNIFQAMTIIQYFLDSNM